MNLPARHSYREKLYTLTQTTNGAVIVWQKGYGEMIYDRRTLENILLGTLSDEHGSQPPPHPGRRYVLSEALKMAR